MNLQSGAVLEDRFRLRAPIGEGGMGTVWSAVRVADGGAVALKILKTAEADSLRRVLREARIAQRLAHPNIVRVEEILTPVDAPPILVMELLTGESLRERLLRVSPLPLEETACILVEVTRAVAAAHDLGIVHRDLKPENVFLEHRDGERVRVKVLDFGIAKVSAPGAMHTAGMTRTGSVLGTPHYMAPEQVFGERDVDAKADVWAIGVMLFECLSGTRPFNGENYGQIFKAITMGTAPALETLRPDLPPELQELASAILDSDREQRPSTGTVLEVLARYAEAASIPSMSPRAVDAFQMADAFAPTALASAHTPPGIEKSAADVPPKTARGVGRRWAKNFAVAGLAALAVIGMVGASAARRSPERPPVVATSGPFQHVVQTSVAPTSSPGAALVTVEKHDEVPTTGSAHPVSMASALPPVSRTATPSRSPSSHAHVSVATPPPPAPHEAPRLPGGVHGESPY
ncbi:MAG TPA: protein kinase [Labilithrix sp.]|nr:protein kinase [Labilithrix sp.]